MKKLLTGYGVAFNLRHKRTGHLFQNRYKSVICEDDPYPLERTRYIHLNPLRAGRVGTLEELNPSPLSERRRIFAESSTLENLKIGGYLAT